MGNEVVKKDILVQYVHDAVDIEVRRHTLNKMREELIISRDKRLEEQELAISLLNSKHEQEINTIEHELRMIDSKYSSKVSSIERRISYKEEDLNEIKNATWKKLLSFDIYDWILPVIGFAFLGAVVGAIIFGICTSLLGAGEEVGLVIVIGMVLGIVIPYNIIKSKRINAAKDWYSCEIESANSDIQKLKTEQQEENETYKKELSQKQSERIALCEQQQLERAEAENDLANEQKMYAELTGHIDVISEKLDTVDSQLREFYSVNLIPPNYRSIECVIAFDQMFRNDLVDTMREAALLYDERVFRGEMITGLNKIYEAINELGGLMSETVSVLRQIESNTSRMCDELCEVSSNLVRMNANVTGHLSTMSSNLSSGFETISKGQSRIETELEYNRYANEAIRANSDRMKWYAEQRWQGLL